MVVIEIFTCLLNFSCPISYLHAVLDFTKMQWYDLVKFIGKEK